jgi:hypothetical protein
MDPDDRQLLVILAATLTLGLISGAALYVAIGWQGW